MFMFVRRVFFLWGQVEKISLRLFRLGLFFNMCSFSDRHKLHLPVTGEYGVVLSKMFHDSLYSFFSLFSFHISSLNVVSYS